MRISDDKNGDLNIFLWKKFYGVLDTISKTIDFYGPSKITKLFFVQHLFLAKTDFNNLLCGLQTIKMEIWKLLVKIFMVNSIPYSRL